MQTVIGLGQAGCNIVNNFKQYTQYKTFFIDTTLQGKGCMAMPTYKTHEEYEEKCPNFKGKLRYTKGKILFILGGGGTISGATLKILEQIKQKDISIIYIQPEVLTLSKTKRLQEKVVYSVLQEYARSGAINRMYLISNSAIADVIQDIPIKSYYNVLNNFIVSNVHMVNVFKNSESIIDTFSEPTNVARLSTYGIVNFETGEEKLFFNLDNVVEKVYYYAMPENVLNEDGQLMKKITEQVKEKTEDDTIKTSYGVFSTSYEQPYIYCVAHSAEIQK